MEGHSKFEEPHLFYSEIFCSDTSGMGTWADPPLFGGEGQFCAMVSLKMAFDLNKSATWVVFWFGDLLI